MAYTDMDRSSINPKGMAVAVLINGGGALAALLLGTSVYEVVKQRSTKITWIEADKPVPIDQKVADKPVKERSSGAAQDRKAATPEASNGAAAGTGLSIDGSGGGDLVLPPADPIIDTIEITPPVIVGAKPDPRFASALQPDYPSSMIRAELGGRVVIRVRIGTDGRVKEAIIVSATTDDFAAVTKKQALAKWRFKPGTRDGVAEESWRTMTVTFEIPK
jgi:periplasmic protein TonB